jgi:hypothetical protein
MGDLGQDLASAGIVRDIVVDLDSTVHRPRVEHNAPWLQAGCAGMSETVLHPII